MTGIVEFLTARLDEREQHARRAEHAVGSKYDPLALSAGETVSMPLVELYREAQPARVLAEVKAKRELLREIEAITVYRTDGESDPDFLKRPAGRMLCAMAAPYDQSPDYNPAWRVE